MSHSIYQLIRESITEEGILSEDFVLPEENSSSGVHWAHGAMDGVFIYHMAHSSLNDDQIAGMAKALEAASSGDVDKADQLFAEWTEKNRAVGVVDELQQYIIDHQSGLNAGNIYRTALHMIMNSAHTECVKIGLETLELFREPASETKDVIRCLGLCDEFTIFSVWNMWKWTDGNNEIFSLAKKVNGWGKIHAVERLEPVSEEIRRWLLTEGTVNGVMNSYSALTCWRKAQAETILSGTPDPEEYKGISTLIDALLDEGPVTGISELNDAERILRRFLELAEKYDLSIKEYDCILNIRNWAEQKYPSIVSCADEILHSPACLAKVGESLVRGEGLQLADELGIPYLPQLFECLQNDFSHHYWHCLQLMNEPEYRDRVLQLFETQLPLSEMEGDLRADAGLGEEYHRYMQLDLIMQGIMNTPLQGTAFILTGLKSPVLRCRNRALAVLKTWVQMTGKPLASLSEELYDAVKKLKDSAGADMPMESVIPLLEGKTQFE